MKVTIEGKEIDLELTDEQKAAVERALKSNTGWERVLYGDEYFFIGANEIAFYEDEHTNGANDDYQKANYFSSKELAENIARAQTLQRKLWRRSAELCEKTEWLSKDNDCYCICYDYSIHGFVVGTFIYARHFGQVYFDTEEHAKQVIEEFRDELTWYFTKFKSRMD